eukprot:CAMPEP_0184034442 /NCGR_PEP_ID=MMETSP0955-20130417/11624_1 /TAXON_ID=627963 /ORGANISM="Aplanochytrium sp, Strain PBS07" /LENGTH=272 /DNA_ID=CAMNT_0026321165 /DNA_START=49 /DNA_END=867 /DNA_ORIENTATION=+
MPKVSSSWGRRHLCGLFKGKGKDFGSSKIDLEVFSRLVNTRRSAKEFLPEKAVEDSVLEKILCLTQRAPSSFNIQPFKVVLVKDKLVKKDLAYCMTDTNIKKVLDAPISVVFASDLQPGKQIPRIMELEKENGMPENVIDGRRFGASVFAAGGNDAERSLMRTLFSTVSNITQMPTINSAEGWAFKNTMLAVQIFLLGCHASGLATAPMEGFDSRRIRKCLNIPDRYEVPVVVSVGYEPEEKSSDSRETARLPFEEVFCLDSFDFPAYRKES